MSASEMVGRGVYVAPYLTAAGGMVLVSVTSTGHRLSELVVPAGDNPIDTMDLMWAELRAKDPIQTQGPHIAPQWRSATAALLFCTSYALSRVDLVAASISGLGQLIT